MAKTTYKDLKSAERREHERSGVNSAAGRSYYYITCPFCNASVKTYVWSIAGGGKRCPCGALHTSLGATYKRAD